MVLYPVDCVTLADKMEYLQNMLEELRLEHNRVVKWRDEGLTSEEYNDDLSPVTKLIYGASTVNDRLSEEDVVSFIKNEHRLRMNTLFAEISKVKREQMKSKRWLEDPMELEKTIE